MSAGLYAYISLTSFTGMRPVASSSYFLSSSSRTECLPVCLPVFWPGAKYESTMDHLKQATLEDSGVGEPEQGEPAFSH